MLHQFFNLPINKKFILACSGGVDSMAILDFYRRGGKNFEVAYFDHNTNNGKNAIPIIHQYCLKYNLNLHIGKLEANKPVHLSPEEFWRYERYKWLSTFDLPVITAHHLNDVAETFLFNTIHNNSHLLMYPYIQLNMEEYLVSIYRPFILTTKQDLIKWCSDHNIQWYEDTSNKNLNFPRNKIRHIILPEILKLNPGFLKSIKKKMIKEYVSLEKFRT